MFILEWIPAWFFTLVIVLGLLVWSSRFLLSVTPQLSVYKTSASILGVTIVCIGIWFHGAAYNQEIWDKRSEDMADRLLVAEGLSIKLEKDLEQSLAKNAEGINQRTIERDKVISGKLADKLDKQCTLPDEVILMHNNAALDKGDE